MHFPDPAECKERIFARLQENPPPVFLVDKAILVQRYFELQKALDRDWPRHVIAYSFKTNYFAAQSKVFQELGAWAEVVSGREYEMAKCLGYRGDQIIFNGLSKTHEQLRRALQCGSHLQINDDDELERLLSVISGEKNRKLERIPIGLRVSTTRTGLKPSRFGCSLEDGTARTTVERICAAEALTLSGLHIHLHGDTDDPSCYRRASEALGGFISTEIPNCLDTLKYLDLGGGFPAHGPQPRSRTSWNPRPIDDYISAITSTLKEFFPKDRLPTLIVEPGRYLVADGMIFLSEVVRTTVAEHAQTITCNASITMVPLTHYCPQIIQAFTRDFERRGPPELPTITYGSSCREDDILFQGPFPHVQPGDYLVHYAVGAYNSNLSPDFIFMAPDVVLL
jgi:diaminopimelate decarboxylase